MEGKSEKERNIKLYLGNLSFDVTEEDLREAARGCGVIKFCTVRRWPDSGKSKGYGHIEYRNEEECIRCFEKVDGIEIKGRPVRMDWCDDMLRDKYPQFGQQSEKNRRLEKERNQIKAAQAHAEKSQKEAAVAAAAVGLGGSGISDVGGSSVGTGSVGDGGDVGIGVGNDDIMKNNDTLNFYLSGGHPAPSSTSSSSLSSLGNANTSSTTACSAQGQHQKRDGIGIGTSGKGGGNIGSSTGGTSPSSLSSSSQASSLSSATSAASSSSHAGGSKGLAVSASLAPNEVDSPEIIALFTSDTKVSHNSVRFAEQMTIRQFIRFMKCLQTAAVDNLELVKKLITERKEVCYAVLHGLFLLGFIDERFDSMKDDRKVAADQLDAQRQLCNAVACQDEFRQTHSHNQLQQSSGIKDDGGGLSLLTAGGVASHHHQLSASPLSAASPIMTPLAFAKGSQKRSMRVHSSASLPSSSLTSSSSSSRAPAMLPQTRTAPSSTADPDTLPPMKRLKGEQQRRPMSDAPSLSLENAESATKRMEIQGFQVKQQQAHHHHPQVNHPPPIVVPPPSVSMMPPQHQHHHQNQQQGIDLVEWKDGRGHPGEAKKDINVVDGGDGMRFDGDGTHGLHHHPQNHTFLHQLSSPSEVEAHHFSAPRHAHALPHSPPHPNQTHQHLKHPRGNQIPPRLPRHHQQMSELDNGMGNNDDSQLHGGSVMNHGRPLHQHHEQQSAPPDFAVAGDLFNGQSFPHHTPHQVPHIHHPNQSHQHHYHLPIGLQNNQSSHHSEHRPHHFEDGKQDQQFHGAQHDAHHMQSVNPNMSNDGPSQFHDHRLPQHQLFHPLDPSLSPHRMHPSEHQPETPASGVGVGAAGSGQGDGATTKNAFSLGQSSYQQSSQFASSSAVPVPSSSPISFLSDSERAPQSDPTSNRVRDPRLLRKQQRQGGGDPLPSGASVGGEKSSSLAAVPSSKSDAEFLFGDDLEPASDDLVAAVLEDSGMLDL